MGWGSGGAGMHRQEVGAGSGEEDEDGAGGEEAAAGWGEDRFSLRQNQ